MSTQKNSAIHDVRLTSEQYNEMQRLIDRIKAISNLLTAATLGGATDALADSTIPEATDAIYDSARKVEEIWRIAFEDWRLLQGHRPIGQDATLQ